MIVSHDLEFVYLGIPRTGNRATHELLSQLSGAKRVGLLHNMDVPDDCRTYFTFCCVRNPYRRMLAYYLWRRLPHSWGSEAGGLSYPEYLAACPRGELGPCSISEFTSGLRLDAVYRYEELPQSLYALSQKLPGIENIAFPTIGRRLSRYWKAYYNKDVAEIVYDLAESEFQDYGYDRDSWMP